MQDVTNRTCARCGQNVNRLKDSFKSMPDGSVIHTSCPASEAVKSLPTITQAEPGRQFIRVADAAKMLSVSERTIDRHIRAGQLPAKRLRATTAGGRATILIDQADVLALLEPYTGAEA